MRWCLSEFAIGAIRGFEVANLIAFCAKLSRSANLSISGPATKLYSTSRLCIGIGERQDGLSKHTGVGYDVLRNGLSAGTGLQSEYSGAISVAP